MDGSAVYSVQLMAKMHFQNLWVDEELLRRKLKDAWNHAEEHHNTDLGRM